MTDDITVRPATDSMIRAEALVAELLRDPKLGKDIRTKAKEMNPDANLRFPEDVVDPVADQLRADLAARDERLTALETLIADRDTKTADDARAADFTAALASAKSKYRLTEAGYEMAVERMRDTKQYDPDAAAAWAAMQNPVTKDPKAYLGPQIADFFGEANFDEKKALLHKDPSGKFLDGEFNEFFADPEKYTREAGFAI
jgi:hypothetical protein